MRRFLPLLTAVGVLAVASGCCCDAKKDHHTGQTAQCRDGQCGEEKKDAKDAERKSAENSDRKQDCEKKTCSRDAEKRVS